VKRQADSRAWRNALAKLKQAGDGVDTDTGRKLKLYRIPLLLRKKPRLKKLSVNASIVRLPIEKLLATQLLVSDKGLQEHKSATAEMPIVYKVDGDLYINDGHHKVVAAKLRGESHINVKLYRGVRE
jgi:hypothetical protein